MNTRSQGGDESRVRANALDVGFLAASGSQALESAVKSARWDVIELSRDEGGSEASSNGDDGRGLHFDNYIKILRSMGYTSFYLVRKGC